ncbi:MAG: type II toxin-antitoxin system RelB/DinJ family antitoxin [Bryobacterales bacterium]
MPSRTTKTQMIHARVDPRLKKSVERIFSDIGISTTEAIRLFLNQVVLHRGLPFPVVVPNEETLAAMREANSPETLRRYGSFDELRRQL